MLIIEDNAENKLINALLKIKKNNDKRLYCIHLQSSIITNFDIFTIQKFITKNIHGHIYNLYLCEDKDIFIIASGVSTKQVDALDSDISDFFIYNDPNKKNIVSILKLSTSHLEAMSLVESKIKDQIEFKPTQNDKKEEEKATDTNNEINMSIYSELIKTIPSRRLEHSTTEILIIEDDSFIRQLLSKSFKKGLNISIAKNGIEGLKTYITKAPDILFLDIGLPDISGHEVLQKVIQYDPEAFIVMLSGKSDKENIVHALKLGAKGFIGKPFTPAKLMEYIEKSPHTS